MQRLAKKFWAKRFFNFRFFVCPKATLFNFVLIKLKNFEKKATLTYLLELLGPFIGGWLFEYGGFIFPYIICGIFTFINALLLTFFVPNSRNTDLEDDENDELINDNRNKSFSYTSGIKVCITYNSYLLDKRVDFKRPGPLFWELK